MKPKNLNALDIIKYLLDNSHGHLTKMAKHFDVYKGEVARVCKELKKKNLIEEEWIEIAGCEASTWIKSITLKGVVSKSLIQDFETDMINSIFDGFGKDIYVSPAALHEITRKIKSLLGDD